MFAFLLLQAARNRFNEFLHIASVPADEADVERLRRERREAAAKDAKGAAGGGAKEVRRRAVFLCTGYSSHELQRAQARVWLGHRPSHAQFFT